MSLKDYPISFGYNQTTTLNGKPYTHKGSDRAAPTGTPILVGSTKIGEVGNTGLSTGSHTHLQAGRDEWAQNTINPDPYWFKGGVIERTGKGSEWGNYVCIKVGDVYVYYCHLDTINVKAGQTISDKGDDMVTDKDVVTAFLGFRMRQPSAAEKKQFVGKWTLSSLNEALAKGTEREQVVNDWQLGKQARSDNWRGQIISLTAENKKLKQGATQLERGKMYIA